MRKGFAVGVLIQAAFFVAPASADTLKGFFDVAEREAVLDYWAVPGRYRVMLPATAEKNGAYQVRLTPEGSFWLWRYNGGLGRGKGGPKLSAQPSSSDQRAWDAWIEKKLAYDRWAAGKDAASRNAMPYDAKEPAAPTAMPSALRGYFGDAPPFASAVRPMVHTVSFDEQTEINLSDNPTMRPNYAFYRYAQGVMSGGTPVKDLPEEELEALFDKAGIEEGTRKVMKAVSILEGGFDSVNTYDTGYVSVGLIQFACLSEGGGSLGGVMLKEKTQDPESFTNDFRKYGLDVTEDGKLVALNLTTGEELVGPAAAQEIIDDKRLIAVFQLAGRKSDAFRVAQLVVAKERYYPSEDLITVNLSGTPVTGKVSDVIRTDAGMATLMDRKVHTGRLDPLPSVLAGIAATNPVSAIVDLAAWELQIVSRLRYRKDYLQDSNLSQPGGSRRGYTPLASRKGSARGKDRR